MYENKLYQEVDDFKRVYTRFTEIVNKRLQKVESDLTDLTFKALGIIDVLDAVIETMEATGLVPKDLFEKKIEESFNRNRGFIAVPDNEELKDGDAVKVSFNIIDQDTSAVIFQEPTPVLYSLGVGAMPFEDQMKTIKIGEKKEFMAMFPEKFDRIPQAAGKEMKVELTCKSRIRRAIERKQQEKDKPQELDAQGNLV